MPLTFSVGEPVRLDVVKPAGLDGFYMLSPFVTTSQDGFGMLLRVVNPSRDPAKKIARIHAAASPDGLRFTVAPEPALAPGPSDEDCDGCEDPSAAIDRDGWHVYYTGWNQRLQRGELLYAAGEDASRLRKRGVALRSGQPYANPKEATIAQGDDGIWSLIFEYASDGASQIGIAKSGSVAGPWTVIPGKLLEQRPASWDNWHLSPGPAYRIGDRYVLFYNGATRDPKWRIGWVILDASLTKTIARCDEPLIVPPPPRGDETDIAFAASAVPCDGGLWLYYSVADQYLYRATIAWEQSHGG
jgi:predicted GH43/DUF377 family glycosyl hydrolase